MVSLAAVLDALTSNRPVEAEAAGVSQAAVAAVLRDAGPAAELLFIHRAEHPHDPWSGHMAFPGGRVEAGDADPLAAAVRETREEIALDLAAEARLVGRLSTLPAMARGRRMPLVILPFVFALEGKPELALSPEVQAVVWVPLDFLADARNRSTLRWTHAGAAVTLPCYRYCGHTIWGLTLRMVDELLELVTGQRFPAWPR